MKNIYLGEAFKVITKTMPFIWLRLGSYFVLGLAITLVLGTALGLSWLLAELWLLGVIIFAIALLISWVMMYWAGKYYFYLLKAAHTAVMTEVIVKGSAPEGSQIAYGKQQVSSRFKDTSIMFGVDVLVDGAVKAVTNKIVRFADMLPIPGLDSLMGIFKRVALGATTYIDESILSRTYKENEPNVWKVAKDGVILYAQAWKPIVLNAVVLALLSYIELLALLIILGLPAVALGFAFPALRIVLGIGVIVMAIMIKLAVSDAFSLAATLTAYHRTTAELNPNLEWQNRLEGISTKFKELVNKAGDSEMVQQFVGQSDAGSEQVSVKNNAPTPSLSGQEF